MTSGQTLLTMPDADIASAHAWTLDRPSPRDWIVPFPAAAVAELDAVVESLRCAPQPAEALKPEAFALAACDEVMRQVLEHLVSGVGQAIVDRIPVERYAVSENRALAWLLGSMLGQIVAQSRDGVLLYDVRDTGKTLGYGVRRSVTNLGQPFHTDGPWLTRPPAFVGLFCLQSALRGGESRLLSLVTVHNELRRRHPDLLARLYQPFHWDRQAEHPPGEPRFATHPVYASGSRTLTARYYEDYIVKGYALAGQTLDTAGSEALAAMREVVEAPEHWVEFRIAQGQLQYINNRLLAHCRTAFADEPGSVSRRHLIRVWNRDEGDRDIEGRRLA